MASDAGDPKGMYWLGKMEMYGRMTDRNLNADRQLAEKAIKEGYQNAKMILAVCYYYGLGLERNAVKAIELWRDVIDAGRFDCVTEFGPAYENGRGVDVDLRTAAELYKMACEDSSDLWKKQIFQAHNGMCLIRGRGGPRDAETGWSLIQSSALSDKDTGLFMHGH